MSAGSDGRGRTLPIEASLNKPLLCRSAEIIWDMRCVKRSSPAKGTTVIGIWFAPPPMISMASPAANELLTNAHNRTTTARLAPKNRGLCNKNRRMGRLEYDISVFVFGSENKVEFPEILLEQVGIVRHRQG